MKEIKEYTIESFKDENGSEKICIEKNWKDMIDILKLHSYSIYLICISSSNEFLKLYKYGRNTRFFK